MGGGVSLAIDEFEAPNPTSPIDAIRYCRRFIDHLIEADTGSAEQQQLVSSSSFSSTSSSTSKEFHDLLDKLKHVEASLMWLAASERRSTEKAHQDVQRHIQAERLKARLAKRKNKQKEQTRHGEMETIDSIELETPRTAAREAHTASLSPRVDTRAADALATKKMADATSKINEVRSVIVDGVVWVTRLLEFGHSSRASGHEDHGIKSFGECNRVLGYLKETSVHFGEVDGKSPNESNLSSPWDDFSSFTVSCPLLLLLKSREIKRGVASYFDFQALMYSINTMHGEAFGAIGALMFGNGGPSFGGVEDEDNEETSRRMGSQMPSSSLMMVDAPPTPTQPSMPMCHRAMLVAFLEEAVGSSSGSSKLKILDVGCGCGSLLDGIGEDVLERMSYVGVDISAESIAMAQRKWCSEEEEEEDDDGGGGGGGGGGSSSRRRKRSIKFIHQDIVENSEFHEEEFDVILANDVLNFMPPSETLLIMSKLKSWLCTDGEMFVSAPILSQDEEKKRSLSSSSSSSNSSSSSSSTSSSSSSTATPSIPSFMCGIERSHPLIPGLFFRMFRRQELQEMAAAVGLQTRRVEIVEPPASSEGKLVVPTAGPPVLTSSKNTTAWGGGGGGGGVVDSSGGSGGWSGGGESKMNMGALDHHNTTLDGDCPPYRAIILVLQTK